MADSVLIPWNRQFEIRRRWLARLSPGKRKLNNRSQMLVLLLELNSGLRISLVVSCYAKTSGLLKRPNQTASLFSLEIAGRFFLAAFAAGYDTVNWRPKSMRDLIWSAQDNSIVYRDFAFPFRFWVKRARTRTFFDRVIGRVRDPRFLFCLRPIPAEP